MRTGGPRCVFVYGTLRRGECNHRWLNNAPLLGRHRTAPRYTLFDLGSYPAAVAGGRAALVGEVYRLTKGLLARLDRLENYPKEYDRARIMTPHGPAWIYLYRRAPPDKPVIAGGDWRRARWRNRSHAPASPTA